jgi:SpoVK/Ycf46/Vps4 family AAA+-type ATPase
MIAPRVATDCFTPTKSPESSPTAGCGAVGEHLTQLAARTELYSASDLKALCHEAAMGPIREQGSNLASVSAARLRPVQLKDMAAALNVIRASVTPAQVNAVKSWAQGSGAAGS